MDFPFPHNYTNETLENTALPGKKNTVFRTSNTDLITVN